jgi:hypothetical protein
VRDSIASPIYYVGGDGSNHTTPDGVLEMGEVWVYTASYTIQNTDRGRLVNIGTVTGRDGNGQVVTAVSTHTTLVAGQTLYLPLIVRVR